MVAVPLPDPEGPGPTLFYGFPVYGEVAVKIARDMSGRFVTHETRSPEPVAEETELLAAFLRERLPDAAGFELYSKTCVYDMPPDRTFVVDAMPGNPIEPFTADRTALTDPSCKPVFAL